MGRRAQNIMLGELNEYHGVLAAWLAHRHRPNVLFVHEAERRRDPEGVLRRLAAFLQVSQRASDELALTQRSARSPPFCHLPISFQYIDAGVCTRPHLVNHRNGWLPCERCVHA